MDGYFRLGMVNQHKDLLKPGDSCIGGGYYHFDFVGEEGKNGMNRSDKLSHFIEIYQLKLAS